MTSDRPPTEPEVLPDPKTTALPRLSQKGVTGVIAVFALVAAVVVVTSLNGGEAGTVTTSTSPSPQATSPQTTPVAGPLVPPIDGCTLLTDSEVEEAMGLIDTEGRSTSNGLFVYSGGEACNWQTTDGTGADGLSVILGPGEEGDFAEGAELDGLEGQAVAGIGDLAIWFSGDDAGTLSLVEATSKGYLFMRVGLSRRDLDDATRQRIVEELAIKAVKRVQFEPPTPVLANLCDLVSEAQAEELLAPHRVNRPAARDDITTLDNFVGTVDLTQTGDFFCQRLILTEIYVKVESGSPSDFDPGSNMGGVVGEPVSGIGDEAAWFAGIPTSGTFASPHEVGLMAIHGANAYFRIGLALPDFGLDDQFEIAKELAAVALARLANGDAVVTTTEHVVGDVSDLSYVQNLLARERSGDWTLGEGLVATLRLLVGEVEQAEVLVHPELVDFSATDIIRLARLYLVTGTEDDAKAELTRLLDLLIMTPGWEKTTIAAGPLTVALGDVSFSPALIAQEEPPEDKYAPPSEIPGGNFEECSNTEPVLPGWVPSAYEVADTGPAKFIVYFPVEGSEDGWKRETHLLWALEALTDSLAVYGPQISPCINILFSHHDGSYTYVLDTNPGGICGVVINRPMRARNKGQFKQQLAADLAHCAIPYNYPGQFDIATYLRPSWWNHALAEYLSNVVYPEVSCGESRCDLEWRLSNSLSAQELGVPLAYRTAPNWLFFQYVASQVGNEGVDALVKALPASSELTEHEDALAGQQQIGKFFHDFTKALTDGSVGDTGGGTVPYAPKEETIPISGKSVILDSPEMFGVTRLHLVIDAGMYACIQSTKDGTALASFRPGSSGKSGVGGGWQPLPEEEDVYSGEIVVVVTATDRDASFTLEVTDVTEDPDCEEEEDPEPPSEPGDPICVCGPTDYFRFAEQLSDWIQAVLPPLSD